MTETEMRDEVRRLLPSAAWAERSWDDVRRRARPVMTRWSVVPVAAAIAAVAVGSAFALYRGGVDFFGADPAPERIQRDFDQMSAHLAEVEKLGGPGFTIEGPAREAMRLQIDGEVRSLWVVPTREGTFCYRFWFSASCLSPEYRRRVEIGAAGSATRDGEGWDWIYGPVLNQAVQEVELLYQDGARVRLPLVWVSAPIDAGFYAYDVPVEHERSGHLTAAVVGRDADGSVVAHRCLPLPANEADASDPTVVALCKRPR
jgi:hypothetical protein